MSMYEFAMKNPEKVQQACEMHADATQKVRKAGGGKQMAGAAAVGAGLGLYVMGPLGAQPFLFFSSSISHFTGAMSIAIHSRCPDTH